MAKVNIPTVKLNNGRDMPALGYGTWLGFNQNFKFSVENIPKFKEALSYAIDIGYRHIDTAHAYRVEPEVGEVIDQKIKDGVVKREDLFVTTKIWNHHHRLADAEEAVRGCLRRLNLEYIDLILMHWPMAISQEGVDEKIDYLETWRGFENVLRKGLVKSIGVSNFNVDQMKRLLANCEVKPATIQVEVNLNYGQTELLEYCRSENIVVVAYSPFGTMVPSRSAPHTPEPKLDNPTLVGLGKKYGKTVTQIALRYLYQRGVVPIPKTITKERVLENASIFDFELEKTDVETLSKFDVGHRAVLPFFWQEYENYPFGVVPRTMDIPQDLLVWKNGIDQNID